MCLKSLSSPKDDCNYHFLLPYQFLINPDPFHHQHMSHLQYLLDQCCLPKCVCGALPRYSPPASLANDFTLQATKRTATLGLNDQTQYNTTQYNEGKYKVHHGIKHLVCSLKWNSGCRIRKISIRAGDVYFCPLNHSAAQKVGL